MGARQLSVVVAVCGALSCRLSRPTVPPPLDFDVYERTADGEVVWQGRLGHTNPALARWFVRPVDPQPSAEALVRTLASRRVPGLALPGWSGTSPQSLSALCSFAGLAWLDLSQTSLDAPAMTTLRSCATLDTLIVNGARIDDAALAALPPLRVLEARETQVTDQAVASLPPSIEELALSRTAVGDEGSRSLRHLSHLRRLELAENRLTKSGLEALAPHTDLRELDLSATGVDDASLATLAHFDRLETLSLASTSVGDQGLRHLRNLTRLVALDLGDTQTTDTGLAGLENATHLEALVLAGTRISDVTGARLSPLSRLRVLDLSNTEVTDATARVLAGLPALRRASLAKTRLTDAGVEALSRLGQLRDLDLEGTSLTAASLPSLARLTQLQALDLGGAPLAEAELSTLATLTELRELRLARTGVTMAKLRQLPALGHLRILDLSGVLLDDADAVWLSTNAPDLELLKLNYTQLGDRGLAALAELKALRRLDVGKTHVTDAGLRSLGRASALRSLDLGLCAVGAGVAHLSALRLESLNLAGTGVDDSAVEHLPATLRHLGLMNARLSPAAVFPLRRLAGLRRVDLRGNGLTPEHVEPLVQARVDVQL